MCDIFISYAKEDRAQAQALAKVLEAKGWSTFWDRTIPIGKTWREVIGKELAQANCVMVLWSNASVGSRWVQEEAEDGQQRGILVPILIEDVLPPIGFRSIQAADLSDWDPTRTTPAFQRLITDTASLIQRAREQKREAEERERQQTEEESRQAKEQERQRAREQKPEAKERERRRAEEESRQAEEREQRRAEEKAIRLEQARQDPEAAERAGKQRSKSAPRWGAPYIRWIAALLGFVVVAGGSVCWYRSTPEEDAVDSQGVAEWDDAIAEGEKRATAARKAEEAREREAEAREQEAEAAAARKAEQQSEREAEAAAARKAKEAQKREAEAAAARKADEARMGRACDDGEAEACYELYRQCGDREAEACYELGLLYLRVGQSKRRAAESFEKACTVGHARACFRLGWCYTEGVGVVKNKTRADFFTRKACALGSKLACDSLR